MDNDFFKQISAALDVDNEPSLELTRMEKIQAGLKKSADMFTDDLLDTDLDAGIEKLNEEGPDDGPGDEDYPDGYEKKDDHVHEMEDGSLTGPALEKEEQGPEEPKEDEDPMAMDKLDEDKPEELDMDKLEEPKSALKKEAVEFGDGPRGGCESKECKNKEVPDEQLVEYYAPQGYMIPGFPAKFCQTCAPQAEKKGWLRDDDDDDDDESTEGTAEELDEPKASLNKKAGAACKKCGADVGPDDPMEPANQKEYCSLHKDLANEDLAATTMFDKIQTVNSTYTFDNPWQRSASKTVVARDYVAEIARESTFSDFEKEKLVGKTCNECIHGKCRECRDVDNETFGSNDWKEMTGKSCECKDSNHPRRENSRTKDKGAEYQHAQAKNSSEIARESLRTMVDEKPPMVGKDKEEVEAAEAAEAAAAAEKERQKGEDWNARKDANKSTKLSQADEAQLDIEDPGHIRDEDQVGDSFICPKCSGPTKKIRGNELICGYIDMSESTSPAKGKWKPGCGWKSETGDGTIDTVEETSWATGGSGEWWDQTKREDRDTSAPEGMFPEQD